MSDNSVSVTYKGAEIANITESGTTKLKTAGTYCEDDIGLVAQLSGGASLQEKTITENGVYTPDSGYDGLSKVTVSVQTGGENVEWHQCPELVRNYLANVTYDPSDYTTSQIANYADGTTVLSNPIGVTAGSETYYNQVPNIETPFVNSTMSGTLKPLDQIRWIKSPTRNARDLGGWACDGGIVKYGKLIRGGEVDASDTEYISTLHDEVGIRAELELQGTNVTEDYSVIGSDVDFCCPKSDGAWWAYYYLTEYPTSMKQAFRFIFDSVKRGRPLYYHCSAGADRTGTISCLIEAILGVSQSDIDKDYELTSFNGDDFRKRCGREVNGTTETYWKNLINAINALTVGSTFRDKVINFIASLGFTADEINEFRANMIDGTPETVTPSISTYTVTNTLTDASTDNSATSATQYQPYSANITCASDKVINSVKVTMGGVDVTNTVWSGTPANLYHSLSLKLENCTSNNALLRIIDGQSYGITIYADADYTLEGATVSITMGGVDVSTYYSDGKITIPKVTGDIVVNVSAVATVHVAPNILTDAFEVDGVTYQPVGYTDDVRLSSSTGETTTLAGAMTTGFIPFKPGMVLRIKPCAVPTDGATAYMLCYYNASYEKTASLYWKASLTNPATVNESDGSCTVTINTSTSASRAYIRLSFVGVGANTYITYDEPLPTDV